MPLLGRRWRPAIGCSPTISNPSPGPGPAHRPDQAQQAVFLTHHPVAAFGEVGQRRAVRPVDPLANLALKGASMPQCFDA